MKPLKNSLLFLFALFMAESALAEPYLAVKNGLKCVACHVNPIGGGKRNTFGNLYGGTSLAKIIEDNIQAPSPGIGNVSDKFSVGGDLRVNAVYRDIPGSDDEVTFETQSGQLYFHFALSDQISLYIDEQLAPSGALNREAFGMIWTEDKRFYLKAGNIMLPYGLRLEDDLAFVREVSGVNFDNNDNGVELGYEGDGWTGNFVVANGTGGRSDDDKQKLLIARLEHIQTSWRVGGTVSHNEFEGGARRDLYNVFGGLNTGAIAWLGQVDYIDSSADDRQEIVSLLEANYSPVQGHNFKLTYEFHDPDIDVDEDERTRSSLVWEHTPYGGVQLRVAARHGEGPSQLAQQNIDELIAQLHFYF